MIARISLVLLGAVLLNACEQSSQTVRTAGPAGDTLAIDSLAVLPNLVGEEKYSASNIQDTLRANRVFDDSLGFAYVTQLATLGDNLVVVDQYTSPHVAMIDARNGNIRERLGVYGSGQLQLRTPSSIVVQSGVAEKAWIYDFDGHKLMTIHKKGEKWVDGDSAVKFNLTASLSSPVPTPGGFISNGLFDDYTLMLMDAKGKPTRQISARPPFSEAKVGHINGRRMLNRNFLVLNPLHSRIALVYQFSNRVDVFTPQGKGVGTIVTPRIPRVRYDYDSRMFYWRSGNEVGYSNATGTARYIYALYCGCLLGQENPPALLHIFTWDGAFVGEVQLDRSVSAIAVSANDSLLFGGSQGPEAKLVEWKLPRWAKTGFHGSSNDKRLTTQ